MPDSRRRTRRDDTVTYRVRVELEDMEPPVWRQLELASDLHLDRLHDVLQVAMGWTNSHLHQFFSGDSPYDPHAERYLMPLSIDEGMVGVDEATVRLDEVLAEPGDRLWYEYDFGDNWTHRIDLDATRERRPDEPTARCLTGANACPPEDSGGPGGYHELVQTLAGPPSTERDEFLTWLGGPFDPTAFDASAVDAALVSGKRVGLPAIDPESVLADVLGQMRFGAPLPIIEALRSLNEPVPPESPDERTAAVRLYTSLLRRVGDSGIALTQAGYLPPAQVVEISAELDVDDFWGRNNREVNALPVLEFRESARRMGLLRKAKGRLLLTRAGRRARDDPEFLWRHIVDALPVAESSRGQEAEGGRHAGALLLLGIAAGLSKDACEELVRAGLSAAGWRDGPMELMSLRGAHHLMRATGDVVEYTRLLPSRYHLDRQPEAPVAPVAVAFARAALGV